MPVCGGVEAYNERSLCLRVSLSRRTDFVLQDHPFCSRPHGQQNIQEMRDQISLMLQKNAITKVAPDTPGFYPNVFLVSKGSGGCHPVIHLKQLNAHI